MPTDAAVVQPGAGHAAQPDAAHQVQRQAHGLGQVGRVDRDRLVAASRQGIMTIATARSLGMTDAELRSPALHRPVRGVCSFTPVTTLRDRCRAVLLVAPPGSVISHLTAARLHDLWLPDLPDEAVHIIRPSGTQRIRRAGVTDHEGLANREVTTIDGIPVTSPADTWADLYATLSMPNLVAAGDGIATSDDSTRELERALGWRQALRSRGVTNLRMAMRRIRVGSWSRLESIGRWVVVNGGMPEPSLNVPILDQHGQWLAYADMAWKEQKICVEVQSKEFHQGRESIDEGRRHLVEGAEWYVGFMYPETIFEDTRARAFVGLLIRQYTLRGGVF